MHIQELFVLLCIYGIRTQDPCTNNQNLNDPTRSVEYALGTSEEGQCDRLLSEGWYSLEGDGNIPTECPAVLRCGSSGSIWLNGTLPTVLNNELTLTVCQRGFIECCEFTWSMTVRNCGLFNVFRLTPTPTCPARYCIEGQSAPCQPGWGSEDGLEPCSLVNITFQVTPVVTPYIPTFNSTSPQNQLAFECRASMPFAYQSYLFDIQWSIDGKVVADRKQMNFSSLKEQGTLHRRDWDPQKSKIIGIRVICAMRARSFANAAPTTYIKSGEFYAGVTVESTTINVQSGSSATIRVKSTVPIACKQVLQNTMCHVRMELFSFTHQFNGNGPEYCNQSLTNDVKPSACGLEFDGTKWNQSQTILVSALTDQTSRPSYKATVKLRAISNLDSLWRSYHLPDITINVFSISRPKRTCKSTTDPNIRTLDGMWFTSLATGEFVMYRNRNKPIEVHTIQNSAGENCAVAVRAASDIFIVYGCGNHPKKWIIRRLNCNEQTQTLEIFERSLGRDFEVILPTGTRVQIFIRSWSGRTWLNVYVTPSFVDWQQTEGLCGTYNGNRRDDFTDRNDNIVAQSVFIKSWGVSQTESLFIARIRNDILKREFFYCSCIQDTFLNVRLVAKADCSWTESLPECQPLNWGQKHCQIKGKRAAEDDIEIDIPEDIVGFKESTLNVQWKNGWNESIARQTCVSYLQQSVLFQTCSSLENVDIDVTIEFCISDIKISGTDTYLIDVREKMKTECISELRYNASLWENSTSSSGSSIITEVFDNDCPNDCSLSGNCTKGICVCFPSYTGDDCSVNLDEPPTLYDISEESLCDLSKRPCTSISLFGNGFYGSSSIVCKLQKAEFSGTEIVGGNTTTTVNGNLETFAEVKCPIAAIGSRRKRSANTVPEPEVVLVSLSMNGATFSSRIPIVIFSSSCSSCIIAENSVTCDLRTDICIVNGTCYDIKDRHCLTMDGNPKPIEDKKSYVIIIGAVVGGVCLLLLVGIVVVKIYNYKRYFVKDSGQSMDSLSSPK